jgi:hypothetical protein
MAARAEEGAPPNGGEAAETYNWAHACRDIAIAAMLGAILFFLTFVAIRHYGDNAQKAASILGIVIPALAGLAGLGAGVVATAGVARGARAETRGAQAEARGARAETTVVRGAARRALGEVRRARETHRPVRTQLNLLRQAAPEQLLGDHFAIPALQSRGDEPVFDVAEGQTNLERVDERLDAAEQELAGILE